MVMMTTINNPPQTILTVSEFENLTSNYYLSNSSGNSYYSAVTLQRLPWVIYNVEINLNAMLNGRLYKRYPPTNLQFNGVNSLTPQVEEETLMQCLTECVEYKLLTQQYVNLNNNYSGNINGQNNYNTRNSNAIGLRQDIQAKLSVLGLYANIIVGEKKPEGVIKSYSNGGYLTVAQLQEIGNYLQNTALQFSQPISFNGGINTSNTINCNDLNATTVNASSINTSELNLNEGKVTLQGVNLALNYNNINYSFPSSMLNFANPWELSLPNWGFFNVSVPNPSSTINLVGMYAIPNATISTITGSTADLIVIKLHYQSLVSFSNSDLTNKSWFNTSIDAIDVSGMLNDFYSTSFSITGIVTPKELEDAGISSSSMLNILNSSTIQIAVDKMDAKVNQVSFDPDVGQNNTVTIIEPLYQGLVPLQGSINYVNNTGISYTISPAINNASFATGSIGASSSSSGIINVVENVYFTIVIQH